MIALRPSRIASRLPLPGIGLVPGDRDDTSPLAARGRGQPRRRIAMRIAHVAGTALPSRVASAALLADYTWDARAARILALPPAGAAAA